MPIVPANEAAYRLKIRRCLTLDLFTRYGTFWTSVDLLREKWHVTPETAVPPEPAFHAELVGLLTRWQMPERFHMPDVERRPYTVGFFLYDMRDVWKAEIPDDVRSGANVTGWMSWTPFLSACVLYDPPAGRLLEYADHDDDNAAALPQVTVWQDTEIAIEAKSGPFANPERLRQSFIKSDVPAPSGKPGKPPLDELEAVQAAVWQRQGLTHAQAAERGGWISHPESNDPRGRKNKNISRVKRGNEILKSREYSG